MNLDELNNKLQQFQTQINQLQTTATPSTSTSYPKVVRTETVEDILANPQWRTELQNEFAASDLGRKANHYAEMLFAEFCEQATGKPSTLLDNLRKETKNGSSGSKNSKRASNPQAGEDA